jgi:hypothetical protein
MGRNLVGQLAGPLADGASERRIAEVVLRLSSYVLANRRITILTVSAA